MKVFLEIEKIQTETETDLGIPTSMLRVEVPADWLDEQIREKCEELVTTLGWTEYKAYKHICRHDESGQCERVELI